MFPIDKASIVCSYSSVKVNLLGVLPQLYGHHMFTLLDRDLIDMVALFHQFCNPSKHRAGQLRLCGVQHAQLTHQGRIPQKNAQFFGHFYCYASLFFGVIRSISDFIAECRSIFFG